MEYQLKEFANNEYKLLVELSHHQTKIKGIDVIPLSQKEIAAECNISYPTTNKLMSSLIEKGCLLNAETKRRYIITPKGLDCIKNLEKIRTIED